MKFDLKRPCPHCPFRTDGPGYLRGDRARSIARGLLEGDSFACHQTTVDVEHDDGGGERAATPDSQFCAGALIMLEREEAPNQAMRIAERLGLYDRARLDMSAPVGRVLDFTERHDENDGDGTCEVVDGGCLAPAGYLIGGVVVRGDPYDGELGSCESCGNEYCEACGSDGRCNYCKEDD